MANVVEILVKANTTQASTGLRQFGSQLNSVVSGLTGFNVSSLGVAAAVVAVGNELKQSIAEWNKYALAMGDAAQLSGITAEEMSRLVQAADDARVSQEALTRSFGIALKNGFVPTIENLAALSDELLAMTDPAERAERASDIFGRGWVDIQRFLLQGGNAIRENTAAIEDGLIVTDQAVADNKRLALQLDALGDSYTALKNTIVSQFVPGLASSLEIFNRNIVAFQNGANLLDVLKQNQIDYAVAERLSAIEAQGVSTAFSDVGTRMAFVEDAAGNLIPITRDLNGELANTAGAASAGQAAMQVYANAIGGIGQQIIQINTDIAKAQNDVTEAQAQWSGGVAQQAAGLLDENRLGAEDYGDALAALDEVMGTSLYTQEQMKTRLEEANAEYAKSRDLEAYKTALAGIKDQFMPMAEQVQEATNKLIELEKKLNALNGKQIDILINIQQQSGVTLPPGAGVPSPTPGGAGTPPPGTGTPAPIPPSTPLPPGTIPLPPGSTSVVINAGGYSQADASRLAAQIAGVIQGRR